MKKFLSVLLAVVMCMLCVAPTALAQDAYTKAHAITPLPEQNGMFTIVPVDRDSNYVPDGEIFRFKIEPKGGYQENDTTCYRAFAAESYYVDIITGNEENAAAFTYDGNDHLIPDENGVYTIGTAQKGIDRDVVIVAYNLMNNGGSGIVNFLVRFGEFITKLLNWFFGLGLNPGAR